MPPRRLTVLKSFRDGVGLVLEFVPHLLIAYPISVLMLD